MHRKSKRKMSLWGFCLSVSLVGCAPKRPIPSTQSSFRLQSLQAETILFAPPVPEAQTIAMPVTLILKSSPNIASVPASCTVKEGPFRVELSRDDQTAIQIELPAPGRWLSNLDRGSAGSADDMTESLYAFLADVDRLQVLGCFSPMSYPVRNYILQSIPMRPSESLFTAYGYLRERGGLDLKDGIRVKIERAYFNPVTAGEEQHTVKNYLGVSTSNFDVKPVSDDRIRFQQVGLIQFSPESLAREGEEGTRDLALGMLPGQRQYRLIFYTYIVPKAQDISAVVIGASNASELDQLEKELRAQPAEGCSKVGKGQECFAFQGFVTVTAQVKIEVNGKFQFVDWGTKLKGVLPKNALKSLRIQRQFMGSYYDVRFSPASSNVLSLTLVGGDRITWSKGSFSFRQTPD